MNSQKKGKEGEKKSWSKKTKKTCNLQIIVIITIPIPKSITKIQIHHFKTTFLHPKSITGGPSDSFFLSFFGLEDPSQSLD